MKKIIKLIRRIKKGLINLLFGKKGKIYLISDLHLNHGNIIKYCHRPFRNARHMNSALLKNWNETVKREDSVYHVGDFALSRHPNSWKKKFTGKIFFIRGNHDRGLIGARGNMRLFYKGYKFWLCHYPDHVPKHWDGWVIHGHTHNNSKRYPFINGYLKTINVSCELIGYKPLLLDRLLSLDINSIRRMETIHSKPERWKKKK